MLLHGFFNNRYLYCIVGCVSTNANGNKRGQASRVVAEDEIQAGYDFDSCASSCGLFLDSEHCVCLYVVSEPNDL